MNRENITGIAVAVVAGLIVAFAALAPFIFAPYTWH